jgi:hypothetical protein
MGAIDYMNANNLNNQLPFNSVIFYAIVSKIEN